MTVGLATPSVTYDENGVTLVRNITFQFFNADELLVTRTDAEGVETVLVLDVDYTVAGGAGAFGVLTLTLAGEDGGKLQIDRATKRSQLIHYEPGDDFPAEDHERALDRDMMIEQEQDLKILSAEQIRQLIASSLVGEGISVAFDADTQKIILTNLYDAEFIRDTIAAALVAGAGVTITVDDVIDQIRIGATELEGLPDCVELSGDQQTGDGAGTGAPPGLTGEQVQDVVGAMLEAGAGIGVTYDDGAGTITIDNTEPAGDTAEEARDAIGAALVGGAQIVITVDDATNQITISTTALAGSYRGLAVVPKAGAFSFDDTHGGKSILYTGGAAAATLELDATNPLSDGWGTLVRNIGTGTLTIAIAAGVELYVNGAVVSAAASIAVGGVASINRWAADELTIIGPKVS